MSISPVMRARLRGSGSGNGSGRQRDLPLCTAPELAPTGERHDVQCQGTPRWIAPLAADSHSTYVRNRTADQHVFAHRASLEVGGRDMK